MRTDRAEAGEPAEPIDVVILWVDVTDEDWQRKRRRARGEKPLSYVGATNDWDLLRYLLRGIDLHCPWVRTVHLVTPGQRPPWLDPSADDIVIVDQAELFPDDQQPTFNSMAVEANLDRIPGLAERFVYFNDDMLVVRPTGSEDVFPHGRPAGFAILNAISGSSAWSHWVLNAVGIVDRAFDKRAVMRHRPLQWFSPRYGRHLLRNVALLPWGSFTGFFEPHLPMALRRRTFAEVRAAAPDEMTRTSTATFRSLDNVIPFVYRYWQLCSGDFTPVSPDRYGEFIQIGRDSIDRIEHALAHPRGHFLCLNDHPEAEDGEVRRRLYDALESAFPERSRFERAPSLGS
ncbi:Stealth CR1 domain-containing protein [Microbacterium aurum]